MDRPLALLLKTSLFALLLVGTGTVRGDEPTGRRTLDTVRGVRIELTSDRPRSDEELAAALEEAARSLRKAPLPPAPVEASAGESLPPIAVTPARAPSDADEGLSSSRWGDILITAGPATFLWTPPLANHLEPRMSGRFTTLENDSTRSTIDTSIGASVGLARFAGPGDGLKVQQDFFAVVHSRFSRNTELVEGDYRFGFPLTFAHGPWHAKVGYEHTSTHQGDDNLLGVWRAGGDEWAKYRRRREQLTRNEIVFGLDRLLGERTRLYGQIGYAFSMSAQREGPMRYDWGVEWYGREPTGPRGAPFAAFDLDLRGEQGYEPNVTAQIGWFWGQMGRRLSAVRVLLEYYDGKSPLGGFAERRENWFGGGLAIDY